MPNDIPSIIEEIKQKMQVKVQRERQFDKHNRQKKIFQTDAKKILQRNREK